MRFSKTPSITSLVILVSCGSALFQSAHAQENAPPYPECDGQTADTTAAKGAFQAGTAAFNEADYERAITYWEDAYRRDCRAHALLKNLARAYELNGMFAKAIVALRTYLERNPGTDEVESLERRIANLETKLQETPAVTETPVQEDPSEPTPGDSTLDPEPEPVTEAADGPSKSAVPLVVAGAGGAVAILGAVMWNGALSDEDAAAQKCLVPSTRMNCPPDAVQDGAEAQDRVTLWGSVAIGGAVVGVAGVIWYLAQPSPSEGAGLVPALAPGFAGLSYDGRF